MRQSAARKRPTNLSLRADLVDAARELNINVSTACELGLAAEVKKAREARWLHDNMAALDSSNAYVEKHGLPLARYRDLAWRS
jgi:antitoxin CcdA